MELARALIRHHDLLWQLQQREVSARYRGTYLGKFWVLAVPILTLLVYTIVFGTIFKAPGANGVGEYALSLFCGFVPWWLFATSVGGAPSLILSRPNLVQKINFPLELLPVVHMGGALFNSLAGLIILILALTVQGISLHWTLLWIPVVYVPLIFFTLGVTYLLAATGVFVRDLEHGVAVVLQLWFFATPIVYPLDMVPGRLRTLLNFNPLTGIVESIRQAALAGAAPDWRVLLILTGLGLATLWVGYLVFMSARRAFADVL